MRIARSFLAITLTASTIWIGCGGSSSTNGGAGAAAGTDANGSAGNESSASGSGHTGHAGTGQTPGGGACLAVGETCQGGTECCSGACDPNSGCVSNVTVCAAPGGSCTSGADCCSLSCVGGICSGDQCISDGQACTDNDACCGGNCGADGKCVALNDSCKTGGNECADNGDCCSGLCDDTKHCKLSSSFCIQPGDSCARDNDCCTGSCTIADGHTVGVCDVPPTGPSYCNKVDGMLCNGCGDCCSRLCAPGPEGIDICQPASGCHVTGDLCRQDTDCCGGDATTGLPGAGNGHCQIEAGAKVGICTNPVNGGNNACNPEGNVCHYLADSGYACNSSSARSDCCGDENPKWQMCKLDALGVPRCLGVGECKPRGEICASAADCCDNVPCVPDGAGALRCLDAGACVPKGGSCTINGDCCPGGLCHRDPGSTVGSCTTSTPPPPTGSAGSGNAGSSNGGSENGGSSTGGTGGTAGTPGVCSEYGQICGQDSDCCNGVPCNNGICAMVVK